MAADNPIRLVALDLDQTVFGMDLVVRPRVQAVIARIKELGTIVTVATGRDPKLAARFARDLGVTAPIVSAQGACIYDHQNDQVLHDVRLRADLVPRILEAAERHGWNIHFEAFDQAYLPAHSNHPPILFELMRYTRWARVGNLLHDMPESPHKLILTLNAVEDGTRVRAELKALLGEELTILASHTHLLEGLPPGADKGHGLAWLAQHLGIAQQHVFAIGDSEADVPMLEWAGVGVAMGNAPPVVKAAADWVAPTLEEDGAAIALERFCLGRDCSP
jgi:Cof subfamily protein (haloacid dehalogenase superfamily)